MPPYTCQSSLDQMQPSSLLNMFKGAPMGIRRPYAHYSTERPDPYDQTYGTFRTTGPSGHRKSQPAAELPPTPRMATSPPTPPSQQQSQGFSRSPPPTIPRNVCRGALPNQRCYGSACLFVHPKTHTDMRKGSCNKSYACTDMWTQKGCAFNHNYPPFPN